jgi:two-component system chemotaxis response regulator CheY
MYQPSCNARIFIYHLDCLKIYSPAPRRSDTKGYCFMLRVVVMDNSAVSRDLLKSLLTTGGHEIVGDTNTSPMGIARAIKMVPQIICIDMGESVPEGAAMLQELRSALPKALVFVVSGQMSPDGVKAAMAAGVHGFIVKPFNSARVLATIRNGVLKLIKQQQPKPEADA